MAIWRRSCVDLGVTLGLFVGSCVDLKTTFPLLKESDLVEWIVSGTLLGFHFKVKILSFSRLLSNSVCFSYCVEEPIEKMAGGSKSMVKIMNPHPLKINVVKFWYVEM